MKQINPNLQNAYGSLDLSFVSDEYKEAFFSWLEYKNRRKQDYKSQRSLESCYSNLQKLCNNDPEKAKLIVKQSINNNYMGLFMENNSNLASFEDLANDITLEKDFKLVCQCIDVLYAYLNGNTNAIRTKYYPGSVRARYRCQRLVASVLSVFPVPSYEEEKKKIEALAALTKIKNMIPFGRRGTLRKEFMSVESAINRRICKIEH